MEEIITMETVDQQGQPPGREGIEIPLDRIRPDTLHNMLAEFVSREWTDDESAVEARIEQVLRHLRERRAKVIYEFETETWNIVECRR